MALSSFHDILFQSKRPWVPQERKAIEEVSSVSTQSQLKMYSGVQVPSPSNKVELAYASFIDKHKHEALQQITATENELKTKTDRAYYIKKTDRQLRDLVFNAKRKQRDIEDDPVSDFILKKLQLVLINLLIDLRLRFESLLSEKEKTPEHIYLMLLDESLPDPSPFYHTAAFYQKKLEQTLTITANSSLTREKRAAKVISFLKQMAADIDGSPRRVHEPSEIEPVVHHAENVIFLIKFGASFIFQTPERLLEPDYCSEWLNDQKRDVLEQEDFKEIEKAYMAAMELKNALAGYHDFLSE